MKKTIILIFFGFSFLPKLVQSQAIDPSNLKKITLKSYPVEGLMWKGVSALNSNWNKITQTPDGKVWYCGGDHWGTNEITGEFAKGENYERPWGFGNTVISYYDPKLDKSFPALEIDRASSIYSNAETPGHGKSHSNIVSDSKGNIYFAGYMGLSYNHEYTNANYPKSYAGAALIRYNPKTKVTDNFGIPFPNGAAVALYYDEKRNTLNGITVDCAKFFRVNLTTMELFRYESVARMSRVEDRVREMIMDKEGNCYFSNDVGGLTKFDPNTDTFTDLDLKLPGKLMDFRSTVVSSKNIIYAISTDGFVWSLDPKTNKLEDLGHVIGMPEQGHYTPNIALDEDWGRLYFMAGNHGGNVLESALEVITVLDLKKKKYHWLAQAENIEGCFGSVVSKNHMVYFSCFGKLLKNNQLERNSKGETITRPYLVKFSPPEKLE